MKKIFTIIMILLSVLVLVSCNPFSKEESFDVLFKTAQNLTTDMQKLRSIKVSGNVEIGKVPYVADESGPSWDSLSAKLTAALEMDVADDVLKGLKFSVSGELKVKGFALSWVDEEWDDDLGWYVDVYEKLNIGTFEVVIKKAEMIVITSESMVYVEVDLSVKRGTQTETVAKKFKFNYNDVLDFYDLDILPSPIKISDMFEMADVDTLVPEIEDTDKDVYKDVVAQYLNIGAITFANGVGTCPITFVDDPDDGLLPPEFFKTGNNLSVSVFVLEGYHFGGAEVKLVLKNLPTSDYPFKSIEGSLKLELGYQNVTIKAPSGSSFVLVEHNKLEETLFDYFENIFDLISDLFAS